MTKYKLAPIEATIDMLSRGANAKIDHTYASIFSMTSIYKAMTAQCETVEVLCKDDQEQAVWQAIQDIKFGNKTDDKCIVQNLIQNGCKIVKVCND